LRFFNKEIVVVEAPHDLWFCTALFLQIDQTKRLRTGILKAALDRIAKPFPTAARRCPNYQL
jgi:hypothetical protein